MSTDHVSTHPDSPLHGNGIGSEAINLAAIRQEYTKGGLKEGDLPDNPLSLFNRWLHEAIDAQVDEPTAMLVGTVSPEGQPSTRTVLLKDLHDGKFIFYTNYESRKGTHLAKNPYISPLFGSFEKLPPVLFQVGSEEVLLDDTLRAADKVRKAHGKLRVTVYEGMFHVFQMALRLIPESRDAWEEVGRFLEVIYRIERKKEGKTVKRVKSGRERSRSEA